MPCSSPSPVDNPAKLSLTLSNTLDYFLVPIARGARFSEFCVMSLRLSFLTHRYCLAYFCALTVILMCTGCGQKGPTTAPVEGRVLLNGQPLTTGNVLTIPDAGRGAKGPIQPDGSFQLGTFKTEDGAIVGTHKVAVVAYNLPANAGPEAASGTLLVPQRYTNPESSELTIEVKAGEVNTSTLELTSP